DRRWSIVSPTYRRHFGRHAGRAAFALFSRAGLGHVLAAPCFHHRACPPRAVARRAAAPPASGRPSAYRGAEPRRRAAAGRTAGGRGQDELPSHLRGRVRRREAHADPGVPARRRRRPGQGLGAGPGWQRPARPVGGPEHRLAGPEQPRPEAAGRGHRASVRGGGRLSADAPIAIGYRINQNNRLKTLCPGARLGLTPAVPGPPSSRRQEVSTMNLKGSKTEENLKYAFAGESQANRRYLYFAQKADVEGYNDIAAVFRSTAEGETGHAHGHLEYLESCGDPATGLPFGDTGSN